MRGIPKGLVAALQTALQASGHSYAVAESSRGRRFLLTRNGRNKIVLESLDDGRIDVTVNGWGFQSTPDGVTDGVLRLVNGESPRDVFGSNYETRVAHNPNLEIR